MHYQGQGQGIMTMRSRNRQEPYSFWTRLCRKPNASNIAFGAHDYLENHELDQIFKTRDMLSQIHYMIHNSIHDGANMKREKVKHDLKRTKYAISFMVRSLAPQHIRTLNTIHFTLRESQSLYKSPRSSWVPFGFCLHLILCYVDFSSSSPSTPKSVESQMDSQHISLTKKRGPMLQ